MYLLGAKRGFGQSMDCAAQSMDGSAHCAANPRIVHRMILIMCIAVSRHVVGTVCSEIV